MALMKCPECGHDVSDKAESCPNCGYKIVKTQGQSEQASSENWVQTTPQIQAQVQKEPKKKKHGCLTAIIVFLLFCALVSKFGGSDEQKEKEPSSTETVSQKEPDSKDKTSENKKENVNKEETPKDKGEENKQTKIPEETKKPVKKVEKELKEWEKEYKNSDIKYVDMKFLYNNAKQYMDCTVISCGKAYSLDDEKIQFDINSKNFFKEITCTFKNKSDISDLNENDKVCFIGKIDDTNSYFGTDTVQIKDCFVVAAGKDTAYYEKTIKKESSKQKKYVSKAKKKEKEKKKKASKNKKDAYIKQCKTYVYKKIQRKPSKYEGKKIKISGTVIQVSEGWFDSVTLRVEDSNGDVWYINYSYSDNEDKILEDDKVTIYGECKGTETYVTVLGGTVTIPAVEAEYIN